MPSSDDVMTSSEQPPIRSRSTLATTTLRTMTSTRDSETMTSIAFSAASRPCSGAVPSTRPPSPGIVSMTSHGTVALRSTGAWEISGAVTLPTCPCWGQLSVAVVWVTGSSGVATAITKPSSPAIIATQRATLTSLFAEVARSEVMAVP